MGGGSLGSFGCLAGPAPPVVRGGLAPPGRPAASRGARRPVACRAAPSGSTAAPGRPTPPWCALRQSTRPAMLATSEAVHHAGCDAPGRGRIGCALVTVAPAGAVQFGIQLCAPRQLVFGKGHPAAVAIFVGTG